MRVLLVNTSERTGGAAIACSRLLEALTAQGVRTKMLCRAKETDRVNVVAAAEGLKAKVPFLVERAEVWARNGFSRAHLWDVDPASWGQDITRLPEFEEADLIHLHWVNQGFLSLASLRRIIASGKPVVWTMHDMWPATAICHHALTCEAFHTACHRCPLLRYPSERDLSARVFRRKMLTYGGDSSRVAFVACSQWLKGAAEKSGLLKGHIIEQIPNALEGAFLHDFDRQACRQRLGLPLDKHLVAFGALRATDRRKGLDYLVEAARLLGEDEVEFVVVGQEAEALAALLPQKVHALGYVSGAEEMARVYAAADCFLTPSLMENLPNTIAEAMAVGTPCVAFHTGGIPEMIAHQQTGYIAEYKNAADLAQGLRFVLSHPETGLAARHAARRAYRPDEVARQHIQLYHAISSPASLS